MLFSAFFLQHFALEAMDLAKPQNTLLLDKEERALLNESLTIIMPDQKVLIEVVGALSNDLFETLSSSPFEKWIYYCSTANALGFSQMIAKMILSIGQYNTSHNVETLMDSAFWKSLSLFQFNAQELYVFKLIFIQYLQKSLRLFGNWRSNNNKDNSFKPHDEIYAFVNNLANLLEENKFLRNKQEEVIRPWEKILAYIFKIITQNTEQNLALSSIKKAIMFDDSEITYKDVKIAYKDIVDITLDIKERQCSVLLTEETGFCDRVKSHKIKFASEQEAVLFAEYLNMIKDLLNMNKNQYSDNLILLLNIYIAGLGHNSEPKDMVFDDKVAKNFRRKSRSKSKEFQPLKLQQVNNSFNRDLRSSLSSSSPKKGDSGKHEKKIIKHDLHNARRNTSDGLRQRGDSARVTFKQS